MVGPGGNCPPQPSWLHHYAPYIKSMDHLQISLFFSSSLSTLFKLCICGHMHASVNDTGRYLISYLIFFIFAFLIWALTLLRILWNVIVAWFFPWSLFIRDSKNSFEQYILNKNLGIRVFSTAWWWWQVSSGGEAKCFLSFFLFSSIC